MTDEGQNSELEALFDSASKDARDMMSEKRTFTKDDYGRVLEDLRKCADWVNELYLFCGNESFEDIQTSHIKYILVPYYQGAITLLSGHAERLKVLGEASSHFNRFINLLNDYGITESKKDTTSTSRDPCTARNRKIEEYHRIKALEEKELSFERMIEDRKDGCDEELLRDYYKLKIENCKAKAVSELQMISKEQEILELKSNNISEIQKAPPEENNSGTARSTPFESLTIISEDQGSLRNSVFNWGLSKPTMTVEQFIESQVRTIGKPLKGGTIPKKEGDECADDYELNDIKTENMRKWDEYKDTSPCGWGNRRNRG